MDDVKKTNPNYGKDGYGNNCPKCSTVVELRKRGMNVQANSGSGQTMKEQASWFKGAKPELTVNKDYALKTISGYPAGSSGFISGQYKGALAGHVIHWTNIGNGVVRFEDGQIGKVYTQEQMVKRYNWQEDRYSFVRVDNCKPDTKAMEKLGVYVDYVGKEEDKK